MGSVHSLAVPVGRLHDPILQLVERIQRFLRERSKTVSTDTRGNLFIGAFDAHAIESMAGRAIGTYNHATSLSVIEHDLRLALRERARRWIVDWDVPTKDSPEHQIPTHRMRRKRRMRAKTAGTQPGNTTGALS